jgi:hypothetical protein
MYVYLYNYVYIESAFYNRNTYSVFTY